jgi:putative DNA methylase
LSLMRTPPLSLLEAGLPCSSLSAECQRDNNARQRPPQNRLHIWWARRPPTVCRAAILSALLPRDFDLPEEVLPLEVTEPTESDITTLPAKFRAHVDFFYQLLTNLPPTRLTKSHREFLRAMGVTGDADRAYRRLEYRENYLVNGNPIIIPMNWTYRHAPAYLVSPSTEMLKAIAGNVRQSLGLSHDDPIVVADTMAGGGAIPLEAVRYGFEVFANDLNPVASLATKATIEYPARFGRSLEGMLQRQVDQIEADVRRRLLKFFPIETPETWWADEEVTIARKFPSKQVVVREPDGHESKKNCNLWLRTLPCPNCNLNIPLSTSFYIVKQGREDDLAAFPLVPPKEFGNDCTFRVVSRNEWPDLRYSYADAPPFDPSGTPTYKDGKARCPRCGHVVDCEEVKAAAQERHLYGGLASQMYAVCSQVPVKLTYHNGDVKIRYLWRFRAPTKADRDGVAAAEAELARLLPRWEAEDLVPNDLVPENMEDKRPIEYGMYRWRDLFLPRQLLTNLTVLEEVRNSIARARQELPPDEAEAVAVYLAFIVSKIVNYNSVNTFWHYGRRTVAQTFTGHDFRFRPAFCEFEGARETVRWGATQVSSAYEELARLIHGEAVTLSDEEEDADAPIDEATVDDISDSDQPATPASTTTEPVHLRPEVIVPTITCEDAAALTEPKPGTVHLICVDPPYYSNVEYSELSNFFYVWLKRALRDVPGLAPLFGEPLAESNREAVANAARWAGEAASELATWKVRYDVAFAQARAAKLRAGDARLAAARAAGPKPPTAKERADRFYENKMAAVFRRNRTLLHPRGRMVVMFNHKFTYAWRALGMALIRAGFEIRSSVPIHTEAESSLNIRGLDAARSTVLLLCLPREEHDQAPGNWTSVQTRVKAAARGAAAHFETQGLTGTDLYLSALGPALGVVSQNWPVTELSGREIDLADALDAAYGAVGLWRLGRIFEDLGKDLDQADLGDVFRPESVDRDTQALWIWLDTFRGAVADSDDVRKLAKSLGVEPRDLQGMGLLKTDKEHKDRFNLQSPLEVDLARLSRRLQGRDARGRAADLWEQREFPNFVGAAVWNAIGLMAGSEDVARGPEAVGRWLADSGTGASSEFRGAFAVTLSLLEKAFGDRPSTPDNWRRTRSEARRAWDLVISKSGVR